MCNKGKQTKAEGLKDIVAGVDFAAVRMDSAGYFEAVLEKNALRPLCQKLETYFGRPVWPSESGVPKNIQERILEYGGVRDGQTLYCLGQDTTYFFAMLWPWSDGVHITLKLGKSCFLK